MTSVWPRLNFSRFKAGAGVKCNAPRSDALYGNGHANPRKRIALASKPFKNGEYLFQSLPPVNEPVGLCCFLKWQATETLFLKLRQTGINAASDISGKDNDLAARSPRVVTFRLMIVFDVEGFILKGGQSRRMGTDKWRLRLGDQTFVERIALALKHIAPHTSFVGDVDEDDAEGSLPVVRDVVPQWGALGGLHAALTACRAQWCCVVACDLPFVTGELFERLLTLTENFDAVVPVQTDLRPQPLCALYKTHACRELATALIHAGERRPRALLQKVKTRWVTFNELSDLHGAQHFFNNINTPEDYTRAKEMMNDER